MTTWYVFIMFSLSGPYVTFGGANADQWRGWPRWEQCIKESKQTLRTLGCWRTDE